MNNREKNGLIIGASMAALMAFQHATEYISNQQLQKDFESIENRADIVTLSPLYGNFQIHREKFLAPKERKSAETSHVLGFDSRKNGWSCTTSSVKNETSEISSQWQTSNGAEGNKEKIAFPRNNCILVAPHDLGQNAPHIENKQEAPKFMI